MNFIFPFEWNWWKIIRFNASNPIQQNTWKYHSINSLILWIHNNNNNETLQCMICTYKIFKWIWLFIHYEIVCFVFICAFRLGYLIHAGKRVAYSKIEKQAHQMARNIFARDKYQYFILVLYSWRIKQHS